MGHYELFFFMSGLCAGSFLNCVADRSVSKKSWIKGRSCCESCGHHLSFYDLIPVFSFLFLKGRCRYCHEKLSFRYPVSEILTGFVYLLSYQKYGTLNPFLFRDLFLFSILILSSFIDMKTFILPDELIILGIANWILSIFFVKEKISYLYEGCAGALFLSFLIFLLYLAFSFIYGKEGIGGGDIKFLFLCGLYSGVYKGLKILLFASATGLIYMMIRKEKMIPFGPFLSLGLFLVMICP